MEPKQPTLVQLLFLPADPAAAAFLHRLCVYEVKEVLDNGNYLISTDIPDQFVEVPASDVSQMLPKHLARFDLIENYGTRTPRSNFLEHTRINLKQDRTPAYGDALRLCRELERENHKLREFIATRHGDPRMYRDDGCLYDNKNNIDFRTEPIDVILKKLQQMSIDKWNQENQK